MVCVPMTSQTIIQVGFVALLVVMALRFIAEGVMPISKDADAMLVMELLEDHINRGKDYNGRNSKFSP